MLSLAVLLLSALRPPGQEVRWDRARGASHAALVRLVSAHLSSGPRALPPAAIHVEEAVGQLPAAYGFASSGPGALLTPDIIAFDERASELLVIEATICPDAALPRYIGRKRSKYRLLCAQATPAAQLRVLPPLVVAVGTGGAVPPSTAVDLARALMLDEGALRPVIAEARSIAGSRPDAPAPATRSLRGPTRRLRRKQAAATRVSSSVDT